MAEPRVSVADLNACIARTIRPEVRALAAYEVAHSEGLIKLDAMENPYTWPREMVDEWCAVLADVVVNRYPDPEASRLKTRLRVAMGIPDSAGLLLGNGSDELIELLALAVAVPDAVVLAPAPTFVMYRHAACAAGMRYESVALGAEDFSLGRETFLEAVARWRPALVFLAYPNNPTGNLWDAAAIDAVIERTPGLVVVDEAYAPFAERSLIERLDRYPNLLVLRTLSKLGLAGLRLGMLAGRPEWLCEINKLRLPYNINTLSQVSAAFALDHAAVLNEQTARIRADREHLMARLQRMTGLRVWPSRANFLLVRLTARPAPAIFRYLREHGVLVKLLDGSDPLLGDCVRVTVGRPEENQRFVEVLEAALVAAPPGLTA